MVGCHPVVLLLAVCIFCPAGVTPLTAWLNRYQVALANVPLDVGVDVGVVVGVGVTTGVRVGVAVRVAVGVTVDVGVAAGVGVGDGPVKPYTSNSQMEYPYPVDLTVPYILTNLAFTVLKVMVAKPPAPVVVDHTVDQLAASLDTSI